MTAPTLERMKFWIVVPKYAENQIKNPTFASPDFAEDWAVKGASGVISTVSDESRWGVYSMKVTPVTGVDSVIYYAGLSVENALDYTFSCYVKGVAAQTMRILITDSSGTAKATTTFTATGYWQRVEVKWTSNANASDYQVNIIRNSVASVLPFYVDGAQFEQNSAATTFFDGYFPGCHWTGTIRNSTSARSDNTGLGGELLCINDYAKILSVHGFGMGQWNQIMTKMTTGGDMYQTHTRKSRNVSMVLAYVGDNQGELQASRKIILDALRPDLLSNLPVTEQFGINMPKTWRGHEQRIIRYQGFDVNGVEATNPVDIICTFQPSHPDTPSLPVFQKDILNFTVPSGLFQGAYNEGAVLDYHADFPAERIVKRDPQGNWCKWTGSAYASLITGLNGNVRCMAEGPDGKIYVGGNFTDAGGVTAADYLARWNPVSEAWEAVLTLNTQVSSIAFDAAGGIAIGFLPPPGGTGDKMVGHWDGTTLTILQSTGAYNISPRYDSVDCLAYDTNGLLWVGGEYNLTSVTARGLGYRNGNNITWIDPSPKTIKCMAWSPDGNKLYVGGEFTNATGSGGDYLAYYDKTDGAFHKVGGVELNGAVYSLAFGATGYLYAGGAFTNAGGIANADYIAKWNGSQWESLGSGTNDIVRNIVVNSGKVYASGSFTTIGGLTLTDRVAVWSNGAWQPLDIDLPGAQIVHAILPASDGSLYLGGSFSTAAETPDENAKTGVVALNFDVASASANTYPVISITGPGTLKSIINYRTGKSVMFDGLTLQAGEWISLNFDPLQLSFRSGWAGRGNLMRYVIAGSDYGDFYVSPGANYISLFMDDTDANSKASITYVPKFWSLEGALL